MSKLRGGMKRARQSSSSSTSGLPHRSSVANIMSNRSSSSSSSKGIKPAFTGGSFRIETLSSENETTNGSMKGDLRRCCCEWLKWLVKIPFYLFLAASLGLVLRTVLLQPRNSATTTTLHGTGRLSSQQRSKAAKASSMNLRGLPRPGEYAPVRVGLSHKPYYQLRSAPQADYHVFVMGKESHIPTIVLGNAMIGLFETNPLESSIATVNWSPAGKTCRTRYRDEWDVPNNVTSTSITYEADVVHLQRDFRLEYKHQVFVAIRDVTTTACETPLEHTMICVDERDLAYNHNSNNRKEDLKAILAKLVYKIKTEIPIFTQVVFQEERAYQRLLAMDDMIRQMWDLPNQSMELKYGAFGTTKLNSNQVGPPPPRQT